MLDAYYSNGEHDVKSIECSVGPGSEFHLDDDSVPDGIISPDKNLIFIPEYRYENPPTRTPDDWLGGIFLVRMPTKDNIADLNGDGIVDSADMCIMIDHWGTDNQLCDIGPMPWGDGVVDVQDLIILAEHLFEEFPQLKLMREMPTAKSSLSWARYLSLLSNQIHPPDIDGNRPKTRSLIWSKSARQSSNHPRLLSLQL